eukprot:gene12996-15287_t
MKVNFVVEGNRPESKKNFNTYGDVSRHTKLWRPIRCEVEGCDVKTVIHKYCGKEHQVGAWPEHKKDCAAFKKHNFWAKFFTVEDQLAVNPIGDLQVKSSEKKCHICGQQPSRNLKLTRTECCGNWVCDNEDQYQLFSGSRDFCGRSHAKYTICGTKSHTARKHQSPDWRTCQQCKVEPPEKGMLAGLFGGPPSKESSLYFGTNGYNFMPMLNVPYNRVTVDCGRCKRAFLSYIEGSSLTMGDNTIICPECEGKR